MLTKLATFRGVANTGEPLNRVFHRGDSIEKVAGQMMPEVQEWLRSYKPSSGTIAVLVNALGASEYWGQNSNGDRFPWAALCHDCENHRGVPHPVDDFTKKQVPPYGYKTFLNAFPYVHHRNKDPSRAFGKVVLAVLNPRMKRVELIVLIDRKKAAKFGAQGVVDRIDAGEFPDVSMGCRVPYDICTICGNKSKTRHDYCDCIKKYGMGYIFPDGRMVGVDNTFPRFFDISFVYIGADKTAKSMAKLGSAMIQTESGLWVPQSLLDAEDLYGVSEEGGEMVKAASDLVTKAMLHSVLRQGKYTAKDIAPYLDDMAIMASRSMKGKKLKEQLDDEDEKAKKASVEVGPPPKHNRSAYPFVGTIKFRGLTIHVENKAGDVRSGTDASGRSWRTKMRHHYGEILGSKGTDGDKLDVYVGPKADADEVYIVHQNHPLDHPSRAGKYDEDKVMLGFASPRAAKKAYLQQYNRPDFFRSMTVMPFDTFKGIVFGEVKGEKVATLQKIAEEVRLEDAFANADIARRRRRMWKDLVTGEESHHVGSGLGTESYDDFKKTASAQQAKPAKLTPEKLASLDLEVKSAALNKASKDKWAEIEKQIDPEGNIGRVVAVLSKGEPDLGSDAMKELGNCPLEQALATPSLMGMMLKPKEFQRLLLTKVNRPDLADSLDKDGVVFPPTDDVEPPCESMGLGHFSPEIMRMLMPLLQRRSYLGPVVQRRIIRIRISKLPKPDEAREEAREEGQEKEGQSQLLTKISAAYNWYRDEAVKLAAQAEELLSMQPELRAAVLGIDERDLFKSAGLGTRAAVILGAIPLTLMYSANLRDKAMDGSKLGPIDQMVADHPLVASMGAAAGLRHMLQSGVLQEALTTLARGA